VRFLRHSKYSIVRATKELQFYLSCPKRYPEYFENFDVDDAKFSAIYDSNCALMMPDVDADGCRIAIFRVACVDTEQVSGFDIRRLIIMVDEIYANMEEIQIAGLKVIWDFSNVSTKFVKLWTPREYKSLVKSLQVPLWYRLKVCYIVNVPSFAVHISNFLMKFASEKMKKRIKIIRNKSELKDHIDVDRLLQEYGGKVSIEESRTYLKELLEEMRDNVSYLDKIDADFDDTTEETSNSSEFEFGPIGSFKKLEID
jgi:hypothetical protein